jgi:hypothetical protein
MVGPHSLSIIDVSMLLDFSHKRAAPVKSCQLSLLQLNERAISRVVDEDMKLRRAQNPGHEEWPA